MKNCFLSFIFLAFVSSNVFAAANYTITITYPKFKQKDKGTICTTNVDMNQEAMKGVLEEIKKTSGTLKYTQKSVHKKACHVYTPAERTKNQNETLEACKREIYRQIFNQVVYDLGQRYTEVKEKKADKEYATYTFNATLGGVKMAEVSTKTVGDGSCKMEMTCTLDLANGTADREVASYFANNPKDTFAHVYDVQLRVSDQANEVYCTAHPGKDSKIKFVKSI